MGAEKASESDSTEPQASDEAPPERVTSVMWDDDGTPWPRPAG